MKNPKWVLLAGGTGGAKLARGFSRVLPAEQFAVIANTGDDFYRLGLRICPDLDSLTYHLAGIHDSNRGWGIAEDTFGCLGQLSRLGEETWFQLGDRDLATHLLRRRFLDRGMSLTETTAELASRFGLRCRLLPMCDAYVPTYLETDRGRLHIQEYFVRERCAPNVSEVLHDRSGAARITESLRNLLGQAREIIIGPSNPFISIAPILEVAGMRESMEGSGARITVVSPIVGGRALKGPTARMMAQLGYPATVAGIARIYGSLPHRLVIDWEDRELVGTLRSGELEVTAMDTIMGSVEAEESVATRLLEMS